jgi:hypothetical protein
MRVEKMRQKMAGEDWRDFASTGQKPPHGGVGAQGRVGARRFFSGVLSSDFAGTSKNYLLLGSALAKAATAEKTGTTTQPNQRPNQ